MNQWQIMMWEPSVSPHKMDLYLALKNSGQVSGITYVAQSDLSEARRTLGWELAGRGEMDCIIGPSDSEVRTLIEKASPETVHIFSGIRWVPSIVSALDAVLKAQRRFGLMSEPRAFEGISGLARLGQSWLSEGPVRRHADFVLGIGRHGPGWFRMAGYKRSTIYPFAYFLPDRAYAAGRPPSGNQRVRVTYLGRTVTEKGIRVFLDALAHVRSPISVTVAGTGRDAAAVEAYAAGHGDDFSYRGAIPMGDVPDLLLNTDILVQPSLTLDDGWGAVVSEALFAGAYVITSDRVGASICLDAPWRGAVIERVTPQKVAAAIDSAIETRQLEQDVASRRSAWASAHLTGAVGATFILDLFNRIYAGSPVEPVPFLEDRRIAPLV
ncbi:glycosyltransferase [Kaistia geumhonensis]|uniref:Glycosyltransferase involved in cell wall biosynthesis n=1 Tax=Kaistia geumhonensis TaxID=410839 RepID=A0ABU0M166_9HYPH|nr:glycosyltransferase [Kaistia geumhonensis]MCX5480089.1 glycosyltransferase [Kaistia geumhonensis]MDQ0514683.1 glycosyltransferase involved in cell wall biosynthesis [Kaistia geumhonensis]